MRFLTRLRTVIAYPGPARRGAKMLPPGVACRAAAIAVSQVLPRCEIGWRGQLAIDMSNVITADIDKCKRSS